MIDFNIQFILLEFEIYKLCFFIRYGENSISKNYIIKFLNEVYIRIYK